MRKGSFEASQFLMVFGKKVKILHRWENGDARYAFSRDLWIRFSSRTGKYRGELPMTKFMETPEAAVLEVGRLLRAAHQKKLKKIESESRARWKSYGIPGEW